MTPIASTLPSRSPNLKLATLLAAFAVFATMALLPYLDMLMSKKISVLPAPFWLVAIGQIAQSGILCLLLGWLGLAAGGRFGLDAPWLRAFAYRTPRNPALQPKWGLAATLGAVTGVVLAVLISFGPALPSDVAGFSEIAQAWRGALASFYGGFVVEILMRLFAVSAIVWALARFNRLQASPWMFVVAIVMAALLFGIGHLPAAFAIGMANSPMMIGKIIALNALGGLVFGSIFWKYGLEHAMLAHFCADIVLHVSLPLSGF